MDDYHAFKSTSGGGGGGGCFPWKTLAIITVIYIVMILLGKCSG